MSKKYLIRAGFTFVDSMGAGKVGGEVIELEDDVAALHLHKLEEIPAPAKKTPKVVKPASDDGAASASVAADGADDVGTAGVPEQPAGQPAGEGV